MTERRERLVDGRSEAPRAKPFPLGTALRRSLAVGYGFETARADVLAGLVVGVVALPLSMALAIASGVPPQHGLYTAIVAGSVAALAALLLVVAWNMAELRHVGHRLRVAPRSDVQVLATCFVLTVLFDMVLAVGVGVVLAAFLFMNRMAEMTRSRVLPDEGNGETDLPAGVALYEITGALFFGHDLGQALAIAADLVALNPHWRTGPPPRPA